MTLHAPAGDDRTTDRPHLDAPGDDGGRGEVRPSRGLATLRRLIARVTVLTLLGALLGGILVVASGTSASAGDKFGKGWVRTNTGTALNVRAEATTSSSVARMVQNKQKLYLRCYVRGAWVKGYEGYRSNLWYRLRLGGYVTDAYLYTGSNDPITRRCGSKPSEPGSGPRPFGTTRSYNGGASGNCTWGAYEKFREYSGVYPAISGNAKDTPPSAAANGWRVQYDPAPKSIVVFQPGVHSASGTYGHMAWVDSVERRNGATYINITEMNFRGYGVWSKRYDLRDISGMQYILAPQRGQRAMSMLPMAAAMGTQPSVG